MKASTDNTPDLDTIRQNLAIGNPVECPLPSGGRLHIERPQPFLCLYRHPNSGDAGTESLLTTQASYLLVAGDQPDPGDLHELLMCILTSLSTRFGNVLLLEIWSGQPGEIDEDTGMLPAMVTLHAANRDAPLRTLEEFDRSLVSSEWPEGSRPTISIAYGANSGPPGLPAALPGHPGGEIEVTRIGVEISPFYRTPISGRPLPEILSGVRKILGLAMRRAFNTFIDTHANFTPGHYHELGPQRLEDIDLRVDRDLEKIDRSVELLLNVTPVNASQAWYRFRRMKYAEAPEFHYRALRIDPADLKRRLFAIPVDAVEDPALHHVFATKREELDRQISMLTDRGTSNFLLESRQVYGSPDEQLVATAIRILEDVPPHTRDDHMSDATDARSFARHAEAEIAYYRERDPTISAAVDIRPDFPGLMVSHGNLIVGADAEVAQHRIDATLQHEIGTHVVTYHNGGRQPLKLLQAGLAGYEELQEGMAVLSEFLVDGLSRPRFRQLAARVEAARQLVDGAEFTEVFRSLHDDRGFNQRAAYTTTMRVFRGGGLTKDIIYLRGLTGVLEFLEQGGSLETLFLGKIGLHHVDLAGELLWRQILEPPRLLPRYLNKERTRIRMEKIESSGGPAIDLVMGSVL